MADKRQRRVAEFIEPLRVKPGSKVILAKDFDPSYKGGMRKKKEGVALLAEGVCLLSEYQARLAAQDKWGVLVVLQALDTAGKDGTILARIHLTEFRHPWLPGKGSPAWISSRAASSVG